MLEHHGARMSVPRRWRIRLLIALVPVAALGAAAGMMRHGLRDAPPAVPPGEPPGAPVPEDIVRQMLNPDGF